MPRKTWGDVQGWADFVNIYEGQVRDCQDGARFVEIGTWVGRSTCRMGELIRESGKCIEFHAVENGIGSRLMRSEVAELTKAGTDIVAELRKNLAACDVEQYVRVHIGDSVQVSQGFPDGYFDFCFIDGDHDKDCVVADVSNWLPKMKVGGLIAGHDLNLPSVWEAITAFWPDPGMLGNSWTHRVTAKDLED